MEGKDSPLRRHGDSRRLATLPTRAERETVKGKVKTLPQAERVPAKLASGSRVVFDTTSELIDTDTGDHRPAGRVLRSDGGADRGGRPRHEPAAVILALFELRPPREPEPEPGPPACLLNLRAAVNVTPPRVDLAEVLLELFSRTGADQAFTSVTGDGARLRDSCVTIAALKHGRQDVQGPTSPSGARTSAASTGCGTVQLSFVPYADASGTTSR
ncbi:hypothetical protein SNE510_60710 [Streptomyces sp. NE5-10]|uniref:hypothetical protein n=1 Tax=Streptomyces sp. NE5-10 TaxID=2759674 RepID=UPI001902FC89|nr:hypothetical protein [Streptomyces sp. NE5-10]GHJ96552.1 hypothetical protein SNE510_60710 [Streptomyces sp. NE5-10]